MARLIATNVDTDFLTRLNIKTDSLFDIINVKIGDILVDCMLGENTPESLAAADALRIMMDIDAEVHNMIHVKTVKGDK